MLCVSAGESTVRRPRGRTGSRLRSSWAGPSSSCAPSRLAPPASECACQNSKRFFLPASSACAISSPAHAAQRRPAEASVLHLRPSGPVPHVAHHAERVDAGLDVRLRALRFFGRPLCRGDAWRACVAHVGMSGRVTSGFPRVSSRIRSRPDGFLTLAALLRSRHRTVRPRPTQRASTAPSDSQSSPRTSATRAAAGPRAGRLLRHPRRRRLLPPVAPGDPVRRLPLAVLQPERSERQRDAHRPHERRRRGLREACVLNASAPPFRCS